MSQIIKKLLTKLHQAQNEDGSFDSQTLLNGKVVGLKQTPYYSSLISIYLESVEDELAIKIRKKIHHFLLKEKSANWTFNYLCRNFDKKITKEKYPDDADDTFLALLALYLYDKSLFTGEVMSIVIKNLISIEKNIGGPYNTWFINKNDDSKDFDMIVNSNILSFLDNFDVKIYQTELFLRKSIEEEVLSKYYHNSLFKYYLLSQRKDKTHSKQILCKLNSYIKSYNDLKGLEKCLLTNTLIKLDQKTPILNTGLSYIINNLDELCDTPYELFIEKFKNKETEYSVCKSFNIALLIEGIHLNNSLKDKLRIFNKIPTEKSEYENSIQKRIKNFGNTLHGKTKSQYHKIIGNILNRKNIGEIISTSFHVHKCIKTNLSKESIEKLDEATIYGWMAYEIYDDIYDEGKRIECLGLANILNRKSYELFCLFDNENKSLVDYYFKKIDQTNTLQYELKAYNNESILSKVEKMSKRYYEKIVFNRAIGHIIGPMLIINQMRDKGKRKKYRKMLYKFFKNYIISKQLNDDVHDWEEDYKNGNITLVHQMIQSGRRISTVTEVQNTTYIDTKDMKREFWQKTIHEVLKIIKGHLDKAGSAIIKLDSESNLSFFFDLLRKQEKGIEKTREESKNILAFLNTF